MLLFVEAQSKRSRILPGCQLSVLKKLVIWDAAEISNPSYCVCELLYKARAIIIRSCKTKRKHNEHASKLLESEARSSFRLLDGSIAAR